MGCGERRFSTLSGVSASNSAVGWIRLILVVCLLAQCLGAGSEPRSVSAMYKKAKQAEKAGNIPEAYIYYAQAAALDPEEKTDAWLRSSALRTRALTEIKPLPDGLDEYDENALDLDPALLGRISPEDLAEAKKPLPPIKLDANDSVHDLDLKANSRELYEKIVPLYGLDVVFDGDFKPGKPIRLRVDGAGYRDALRILGAATGTFVVPVSDRLILVAKDTTQERQQVSQNVAVAIPIPETVTVQEAQELAQAVQQVMELKKLTVDTQRRLVLIRDRISRVRPAQALFDQLMLSRPEVVIEVEFLEVGKTNSLAYGFKPPTEITVSFLGLGNGIIPLGTGLNIGLFGISVGNAELAASMARSNSRSLLRSQLRATDGQTAELHVGDRYPIAVNQYLGNTGGSGQAFTPPPQINFEDLGVVVKVTPHIHGDHEVTMEVEAEFKVLAGSAFNGIPVIATRSFKGTVRMKSDEWAIMAGLVKDSDTRAITGLAGLASVPYLGAFFRKTTKNSENSETLLVLKPSIVRMPYPKEGIVIDTGTESRPRVPL